LLVVNRNYVSFYLEVNKYINKCQKLKTEANNTGCDKMYSVHYIDQNGTFVLVIDIL